MKIKDLINDASNRLCAAGIEEPRFEAELFMAETLKKAVFRFLHNGMRRPAKNSSWLLKV